MWLVRAGRNAAWIEFFKEKSLIAIGWESLGDLTNISRNALKEYVKSTYPHYSKGELSASTGMIARFRYEFKKGDSVLTYNPESREYLCGEIISDYMFNKKFSDSPHVRSVKWQRVIDRDSLTISTKNSLGSISTLFKVSDDAESEIKKLPDGKDISRAAEDLGVELSELKEDMQEKSIEFVKDKIVSLSWEDMQELVAGLLRAMGYKTLVSAKGPDGGCDIQASPDGLGLEDPRIYTEVKHRKGQMGASEVRSFTGGLRQGSKGLYISTGGFSKEAKYEAERSDKPTTLIDLDRLTRLVMQYYDNFDADSKALLPLTKIYWPV